MSKRAIETMVGVFVLLGIAGIVFLALKAANLGSFSGGDTYTLMAAMPSSTNTPTMVSMPFLPIVLSLQSWFYGVENINAVSTKSVASTPSEAMTTVRVVAWATPSGVAFAS